MCLIPMRYMDDIAVHNLRKYLKAEGAPDFLGASKTSLERSAPLLGSSSCWPDSVPWCSALGARACVCSCCIICACSATWELNCCTCMRQQLLVPRALPDFVTTDLPKSRLWRPHFWIRSACVGGSDHRHKGGACTCSARRASLEGPKNTCRAPRTAKAPTP